MQKPAEVQAREPASDILREAARLGLDLQPEMLPTSASDLYQAIDDSLIPRLNFTRPQRRRIALDTTITLCAEHTGKRLVPSNVYRVERTITRCFALHGLSRECVPYTLKVLANYCTGGISVPSLKSLGNRVRDEQIRRDYRDGADYSSVARCHDLTPRRIRQILNPA